MIISGGKRAYWQKFAPHLMNTEKGMQRVRIVEIRGLAADNLVDAFHELEALGSATRAKNFYYHANIDPRAEEHMSEEEWEHAVDTLEKNLGLQGQERIVVEHEKNGRTHRHVLWSRVTDELKVVPHDFDYSIHQRTADQLEKEFGHEATPRQREAGKAKGPDNWEYFRGKESRINPKEVQAEITALWHQCDSGQALAAAIEEHGYILCEGRKGLLIVDAAGHEHSLARRCGVRVKEINARMADVRDGLPTVEEARSMARARAAERGERENLKDEHHDPLPSPHPQKAPGALQGIAEELSEAVQKVFGKQEHPPPAEYREAPEPTPSVPGPEPLEAILPPAPSLFDRLAEKLADAAHDFSGGPTAAEFLDPLAQPPPRSPPVAFPAHPEPTAFDRLATEFIQGAKDAAPVVEELAVAAAAVEEHQPTEFERFVAESKEATRAGGDIMGFTSGLHWLARKLGQLVAEAPPPDRELTPFERFVADAKQQLRENGGEPAPGFWARGVSILAAARERAMEWAREPVRSFVGLILRNRNSRDPDNHEIER